MRAALTALIGAATLAAMAPPAVAQTPADRSDARCLLVLQAVSRDPKQKEAAGRGIYYFLGRIGARGSVSRIEPVLMAEAKAINSPQQVQAELSRCGNELQARTQEYDAVDRRIAATARPAAPAGKPAAK